MYSQTKFPLMIDYLEGIGFFAADIFPALKSH